MTTVSPNEIGGYEYRFINDPPDALVCKICFHACRDPYLSGCCGHNFCKTCLDAARRTATICPFCRNEEFVIFANKLSDREIRCLQVMCTNKERGCEWQGELRDINTHLGKSDGCQFQNVKCFNECGKMLQRQRLNSHAETECPRRKVECQYCHNIGEYQFIEGEHKKQCHRLPLPCPNRCEIGSVPREDIEEHRKECPLEMVKCPIECGKMLQRRYLTSHVETDCPRRKVDCQFCHISGEHQFIEGKHKEQCPKLPLSCPNNCEVGSVPREDMETHRKECPLEMVQCEYHDVGCEERMMRKDMEAHSDRMVKQHLKMTRKKLVDAMDRIMKLEAMISSDAMHYAIKSSFTLWTFQLITMVSSENGLMPVTFKVTEYTNAQRTNKIWFSPSFFTKSKGYRLCLKVSPSGENDGKGTHTTIYMYLMKGPYDDELTWPLRGTFEVKILNQISDCEHYTLKVYYNERTSSKSADRVTDGDKAKHGKGSSKFISNEDLHKITPTCQYLKDDCAFLQVSEL